MKLANPLVDDLLELADQLAKQGGRKNLRQAALRRSVSTAYYALFHAICFVCASELVGWSKTDVLEPIYRALDHGPLKNALSSAEASAIHPNLETIGDRFRTLHRERQLADYRRPVDLYRRRQAQELIESAREAVRLIEDLDRPSRLRLAVLLISRSRSVKA